MVVEASEVLEATVAETGENSVNSGWLVYARYSSWEHSLAFSLEKERSLISVYKHLEVL